MTSKRHKVKNREPDTYPSCILCGKGDLGPYTLQVVQAGGEEPVWTHGHCYAEVHDVGDAREADPWDMLAAIDAVISAAIRRIDVDLGANGRQALGIALGRESFSIRCSPGLLTVTG
jgi:hypothetical protein